MKAISLALALALALALSFSAQAQEATAKPVSLFGRHSVASFAEWLESQGVEFVVSGNLEKDEPLAFFNIRDKSIDVVLNAFAAATGYGWHRVDGIVYLLPSSRVSMGAATAPATVADAVPERGEAVYAAPGMQARAAIAMPMSAGLRVRRGIPVRPALNLNQAQKTFLWTKGYVPYSLLDPNQRKLVPNFRGTFIYNSGGVLVAIGRP